MARIRAIHYLNQFFGGLGGEAQADAPPTLVPGAKGPGLLLQRLVPDIEVVATVVAGDDFMSTAEAAVDAVVALVRDAPAADVLIAGPAFVAGRYGMACGAVCEAVSEQLSLPTVTAMHEENPGVDTYRRDVTIVRTERDVMGMNDAIKRVGDLAGKLVSGQAVDPAVDGTFPRGVRRNRFSEQTGAHRAVAMLLRKLAGEPIDTEYAMPTFDRVTPAPPIADLSSCRIALVTSGGIVPRGNPDRIESANASRWGAYDISGVTALDASTHMTVHGGYDPTYATEDPNRVLPLDVVRDLVHEGRVGSLHDAYFATVGNATSVASARAFGAAMATALREAHVQAVILTST